MSLESPRSFDANLGDDNDFGYIMGPNGEIYQYDQSLVEQIHETAKRTGANLVYLKNDAERDLYGTTRKAFRGN